VLAEAATLGLAIKRWGCLLNGCCRGVPARAPWALAFTDPASRVPRALLGVPLHPVQAYEALLCLALFAAGRTVLRERLARPGASFAYHAAGYALIRLALEPFRAATPGLLDAGLGTAQWLSLASGAGALLLSRRWRRA
jgi:prolipoprotein diacylglyceryltransferase